MTLVRTLKNGTVKEKVYRLLKIENMAIPKIKTNLFSFKTFRSPDKIDINDDNVNNVSAAINYPKALTTKNYDSINGLLERKRFFNLLKEIIGYEECGA